ncbi:MAG: molybdopterin-dependent oxidoreductase [Granulosicoccus sp.]
MTDIIVNGDTIKVETHPMTRLSDVLRGPLGLTGTKVGCNTGDCGACTVLLDGKPVCSCITAVAQAQGCTVDTVEGLDSDGLLSQLQQSFLHFGAAQCGICTPGMLMSAKSLLAVTPRPDRQQVEDALGGVLCRCTGYNKIIQAVMHATDFIGQDVTPAIGHNVGAVIRHLDGEPKVTGSLRFGADTVPVDALALRVIRSEYHAARFVLGDTQAFVDAHDGIECVLTARDIKGRNCFGVIPPFADQPVFAEGRVLFRGEAVAAVVGHPDTIAGFDLSAFPIEWQALDAVMTPDDALSANTSTLHEQREQNILVRGLVERGNAQQALDHCAYTAKVSSSTPFIEHGYIEPEAGYARRNGNRLEIHGCTQATQMDREALADIMGLGLDDVRVIPSACGGGFGSKIDVSFQPYIALAAWVTNKPVTVCYTRPESMRSTTKRHPSDIHLRVGCDKNGKVMAFDFEATFNTGAYASWGPTVANRVPVHASGPYFIPHYSARSLAVHTNTPPAGAFRGFGVPQSAIAQECAFDELADQLGMDRLDFRLLNALRNGEPTVTGQVFESGVGIVECLEALKPAWNTAQQKAAEFNAVANGSAMRKGVGLATCWYGCGNTSLPNPSTIRIGIKPSGEIVLHQGAMDIGQGSNTVITQIAADALGVSVHDISMVDGDTDLTPDCGKTSASRQTFITGAAAKLSGESLRTQLLRQANVGPDAQLSFSQGCVELQGDGAHVRLDLCAMQGNELGYVFMAEETYDPVTRALDEKGQGIPYALYGYGAQLIELTVDVRLGTIKLDHITTAHDVGRAINPMLVEGQIEGGVAQGIGMAVMEDYQPGRTENLHDYLMPTFGDMPQFTHIIVEVEDPVGPFGAKGLGEHVLIPTAPAIVNAIRDATGAVVRNLPATPDKVLAAIQAMQEGA